MERNSILIIKSHLCRSLTFGSTRWLKLLSNSLAFSIASGIWR